MDAIQEEKRKRVTQKQILNMGRMAPTPKKTRAIWTKLHKNSSNNSFPQGICSPKGKTEQTAGFPGPNDHFLPWRPDNGTQSTDLKEK
ncbi:MAG: hypothetical protein MI747_01725 [Desulfobacterales bacterium]|nr:hypothetical protein [Desulfobacterales bacterium]